MEQAHQYKYFFQALSFKNYVKRFDTLLYIESIEQKNQLLQYTLTRVSLTYSLTGVGLQYTATHSNVFRQIEYLANK